MKTVILSLLLLASSAYEGNSTYVYICTGPKAEVYHSTPKCSGLNRCSDEVVKVSLSQKQRKWDVERVRNVIKSDRIKSG